MLRTLRFSLSLLGETFKSFQFNGLMTLIIAVIGIVLPFFSREEIAKIPGINLDTPSHIIQYMVLVFGLILVVVVVFQFTSSFFTWCSEQVPTGIDIIPVRDIDMENKYNDNLSKNITYSYASLRIVNREYEELTDCYAVLKAIHIFSAPFGFVEMTSFFSGGIGAKLLGWKGTNDCYTKIGPRTGEQILRVYRFGIDNKDNSRAISDFNICDNSYKGMNAQNTEYFFEIEIYGKLKNKDIKPRMFHGFIKVDYLQTDTGATYGVGIWKDDIRIRILKKMNIKRPKTIKKLPSKDRAD